MELEHEKSYQDSQSEETSEGSNQGELSDPESEQEFSVEKTAYAPGQLKLKISAKPVSKTWKRKGEKKTKRHFLQQADLNISKRTFCEKDHQKDSPAKIHNRKDSDNEDMHIYAESAPLSGQKNHTYAEVFPPKSNSSHDNCGGNEPESFMKFNVTSSTTAKEIAQKQRTAGYEISSKESPDSGIQSNESVTGSPPNSHRNFRGACPETSKKTSQSDCCPAYSQTSFSQFVEDKLQSDTFQLYDVSCTTTHDAGKSFEATDTITSGLDEERNEHPLDESMPKLVAEIPSVSNFQQSMCSVNPSGACDIDQDFQVVEKQRFKRGPGRPKGSKNKKKSGFDMLFKSKNKYSAYRQSLCKQKLIVKKPVDVEERITTINIDRAADILISLEAPQLTAEPTIKRKRGRPRKDPPPTLDPVETVVRAPDCTIEECYSSRLSEQSHLVIADNNTGVEPKEKVELSPGVDFDTLIKSVHNSIDMQFEKRIDDKFDSAGVKTTIPGNEKGRESVDGNSVNNKTKCDAVDGSAQKVILQVPTNINKKKSSKKPHTHVMMRSSRKRNKKKKRSMDLLCTEIDAPEIGLSEEGALFSREWRQGQLDNVSPFQNQKVLGTEMGLYMLPPSTTPLSALPGHYLSYMDIVMGEDRHQILRPGPSMSPASSDQAASNSTSEPNFLFPALHGDATLLDIKKKKVPTATLR